MSSVFYPSLAYISNITLGTTTIVTFTEDHSFTLGENISLRVSARYGTRELNNREGTVIALTSNTVTLDIDSVGFTPYTTPSSAGAYPAVAVPSSSGIIPRQYVPTVTLSDAFDNVPE